MRLNQTNRATTWLTIALFILPAATSVTGQVLCVSEDSHMQVESSGDSCCDFSFFQPDMIELLSSNQGQSGCGICRDVGLNLANSTRVLLRSAKMTSPSLVAGQVWSMFTKVSTYGLNGQTLWQECLPVLTQPQSSVSVAILIC